MTHHVQDLEGNRKRLWAIEVLLHLLQHRWQALAVLGKVHRARGDRVPKIHALMIRRCLGRSYC